MIIVGKNPVKDLFNQAPNKIKKVWIDRKRHQNFAKEVESAGITILDFNDFKGEEKKLTHQGIFADVDEPNFVDIDKLIQDANGRPILILDQVSDPQNFGAIIRNVAAFNGGGIIIPKHNSAPLSAVAVKASAGTWINVNISEAPSMSNAIRKIKEEGYWIASTVLNGDKSLKDLEEFDAPLAIILGNEGKGVRKSLVDNSDLLVKINMSDKAESLNVSAASAVILSRLFNK